MINAGTIKAQSLIKELKIDDPLILEHLEDICMHRKLLIKKEEISNAEGRLVFGSQGVEVEAVATVHASESYESRTRFSIAHEFGHFELHKNQDFNCNIFAMNEWFAKEAQKQLEVEANSFASEFLMPAIFVKPKMKAKNPSMDLIQSLSEEFKTSLAASAMKFLENTEEACAVVFFDKNGVKHHFRSKVFENQQYWVPPGPLHKDTYAFDVSSGKAGGLVMSDVSFDSWVDISGKPQWVQDKLSDKSIKEQSIWFPRLQKGMALLWIKDSSLIWA